MNQLMEWFGLLEAKCRTLTRYGAMNQLMDWFGLFEAKCRTLTRYGGHEPTDGVVWFIGSKMSDTHEVRGP